MVISVRDLMSCANYSLSQRLKSSRDTESMSRGWTPKKTSLWYTKALGDIRRPCEQTAWPTPTYSYKSFSICHSASYIPCTSYGDAGDENSCLKQKGERHIQARHLHSFCPFPHPPSSRESSRHHAVSSCPCKQAGISHTIISSWLELVLPLTPSGSVPAVPPFLWPFKGLIPNTKIKYIWVTSLFLSCIFFVKHWNV